MKASDLLAGILQKRQAGARAAGPDATAPPLPGAPPPLVQQSKGPGLTASGILGALKGAGQYYGAQAGGPPPAAADDFGYDHVRRTAEQQQPGAGTFAAEERRFGVPTAPPPSIDRPVEPPLHRDPKAFGSPEHVLTRFGSLPAYRNGGDMPAGRPAVVGEEEPEVVVPNQDSVALPLSRVIKQVAAGLASQPASAQGRQSAVQTVARVPEAAAAPQSPQMFAPRSVMETVRSLAQQQQSRTPAQLQGLGIPADAQELPKVPGSVGEDESFTADPGAQVRPRRVTPQTPPAPVPPPELAGGVPPVALDASISARPDLEGEHDPAQLDSPAPEQTRARVAAPVDWLRKKLGEESARQPADRNGGWKSAVLSALITGADALGQSGDWRTALAAAGTGAVVGGIDKSFDESLRHRRYVEKLQKEYEGEVAREGDRLKAEGARADIDVKTANAAWVRERPDLEREKLTSAQLDRKQKAVQREIAQRLRDPRPFDENDAYDSDLAERAAAAGVSMNRAGFGDAQKPFTIEALDPMDPQHIRKVRLQFDRATRQWAPVQTEGETVVTNRVQPVGDDGRTPDQRERDADRDAARANTEAYRKQLLGLSTRRLRQQMTNGLDAAATRRFNVETEGLFERRRQIEGQIQTWNTRAAKAEISGAERDRRTAELVAERDGITAKIETARGAALGATSAAPPAPTAPAGRVSRKNFGQVRKQNPSLAGKSDAEVEAALKAQGIDVY